MLPILLENLTYNNNSIIKNKAEKLLMYLEHMNVYEEDEYDNSNTSYSTSFSNNSLFYKK